MKVIGLSGFAESGKSYVANKLKEHFESQGKSVQILSFAEKLRQEVCELYNIKYKTIAGDADKKKTIKIKNDKVVVRDLLQRHGSFTRSIDRDYYVNAWKNSVNYNVDIVISDDVRYANEEQAIKNMDGITIRLVREGTYGLAHESENQKLNPTYNMKNNDDKNLEFIIKTVDEYVDKWKSTINMLYG